MSSSPPEQHGADELNAGAQRKPSPLIDILISIVLPSLILMKASGDDRLGPTGALLVALAFPVLYGLHDLLRYRSRNLMAVLGIVSVLLTGGIGLLEIDARWLAVKEAAIPLIIGIGVIVANRLGYPLVRKLLFNPSLMNVERINDELEARDNKVEFEHRLDRANYLLAGTFLFSSIMNYLLARLIVKSDSGTQAFNEELGRMTLLSYPVIAIPSMVMMLCIFWFIWKTISRLTGLGLEEALNNPDDKAEKRDA